MYIRLCVCIGVRVLCKYGWLDLRIAPNTCFGLKYWIFYMFWFTHIVCMPRFSLLYVRVVSFVGAMCRCLCQCVFFSGGRICVCECCSDFQYVWIFICVCVCDGVCGGMFVYVVCVCQHCFHGFYTMRAILVFVWIALLFPGLFCDCCLWVYVCFLLCVFWFVYLVFACGCDWLFVPLI